MIACGASQVANRVTISTPLEESMNTDDIYRGVKLYIEGLGLNVDLMLLELYDFDLISGHGLVKQT